MEDNFNYNPQIVVLETSENEDGSLVVSLDINEDGKKILIEAGFNALLKEALNKFDNNGEV